LEQQTATAEILSIISSSPTDVQRVFDTIVRNFVSLCGGISGTIFTFDGKLVHLAGAYGFSPDQLNEVRKKFQVSDRSVLSARAILAKAPVHIQDTMSDPHYDREHAAASGARRMLAVPMLREGVALGAIVAAWAEAGATPKQHEHLLKVFADQAVIAIENTRLLNELNKLNQQLEQRVTDQVSEIERMGRLRLFLPPQVADLIVASGTEKQLESHRREITALFCDLRGFTGFSESSDPEDVMALLREYHAAIGEIINTYGGTLERYAGDGVMVVFNDPIPVDNPALQAVLMAIEMRSAIGELIEKWRKLGHDIGFGIGIAHGFATLGTIGFEGRFDYAAIGTVSNVASRLCDEAKPGQILISPRVLMAVEKDITVEPVGDFALKGIRRPLTAYNVLAAKNVN
jgi:class 3 adenylate cyclase